MINYAHVVSENFKMIYLIINLFMEWLLANKFNLNVYKYCHDSNKYLRKLNCLQDLNSLTQLSVQTFMCQQNCVMYY